MQLEDPVAHNSGRIVAGAIVTVPSVGRSCFCLHRTPTGGMGFRCGAFGLAVNSELQRGVEVRLRC